MKKLGTVISALLFTVALTACGTADVNDVNDRRGIYDVNGINDRDIYDNDNGFYNGRDNLFDYNDRNNYNYPPLKDSPLRNDPEANDWDNNVFDADRDDTMFDDEDLNMNRTYNNR